MGEQRELEGWRKELGGQNIQSLAVGPRQSPQEGWQMVQKLEPEERK